MGDGQQCHRLYLIRHGETVDNVAGLYAGIRDSALTNHGVQQALRLGQYFSNNGISFTHIFSSNLTRAYKTAEAIRTAQQSHNKSTLALDALTVVQLAELREQDFGYYEGKPFYARSPNSKQMGKDEHRAVHQKEEDFQDVETKESMAERGNKFLDKALLPLLNGSNPNVGLVIAIVSHGIMLSSLWRCLLRRQPHNTVTMNPELTATANPVSLDHLGGWINTGYLELELRHIVQQLGEPEAAKLHDHSKPPAGERTFTEKSSSDFKSHKPADVGKVKVEDVVTRRGYTITIKTINGKEHLKSLKRTGGGVGSAKFDEGQRSIETFFKRQKTS